MKGYINKPKFGTKIIMDEAEGKVIPDKPVIPYIEGDGIGVDITPVMIKVLDAAVLKAYGAKRKIDWLEIYAGEKANALYGGDIWLPDETLETIKECRVAIKGPLTTPVGKGIRSLNVMIRQKLDLYTCLRPVRYFEGVPSPVKEPEKTNMVIFRENSEDIYAGIEWQPGSPEAQQVINFLQEDMHVKKIRFPDNCGIGIKPVSKAGTERLVSAAIDYAIDNDLPSVTLVHKGNIMKFTEGAFKDWGYLLAKERYQGALYEGGPWVVIKNPKKGNNIIIKDVIADAFLQQILLRPEDYSVIATLNLNGDYISDALAAMVGGIGIAPGANIGKGLAVFEATHGTAPKYAGKNKVNPGSLILSGEMMLRYLGWTEAANLLIKAMSQTISSGKVTYDFARLDKNAEEVSCSKFGEELVSRL